MQTIGDSLLSWISKGGNKSQDYISVFCCIIKPLIIFKSEHESINCGEIVDLCSRFILCYAVL